VRDLGFAGETTVPRTRLQVYLPFTRNPGRYFQIAVRTTGSPATLANSLRQIIAGIDPEIPADDIRTVTQTIEQRTQTFELINQLLVAFAGLGLLLTLIGLYGVISNLVVQRTAEFGIRLALGAQPADVLRLVMGKGLRLAALGTVLGLSGSFALFRLFAALLPVFPGQDWLLVGFTVAGLLAVAVLACWLPARRATKVDPMTALRAE
jgi:putative ABC transport system permease protein